MRILIIFVALLLTGVATVMAQPRGRGMRVDRLLLLDVDDVQTELNMSEEQIAQVKEAAQQLGEPVRPRGPIEELSDKDRTALRDKAQTRAAKEKALLSDILSTEQMNRLRQIMLQVMGSRALQNPDVSEQLEITAEQRQQMAATRQAVSTEMRATMRKISEEDRGDFEQMRTRMKELRENMEDQVLKHLSDEQRTRFAEMKGEAFELPMDKLFRGRGGRAFGRGRRPGGDERPERPQRPPID